MEALIAIAMDFIIFGFFTSMIACVSFIFRAKIRTELQEFLGITPKEKIHVLRHK